MSKKATHYTYDNTRKLGSLIPLEARNKESKEKEISQVTIDEIRIARGQPTWTGKDIMVLRAAALCEIKYYYRSLKETAKNNKNEKLLKKLDIDRDELALEIMKGISVDVAFAKYCDEVIWQDLNSPDSGGQEAISK